MYGRGTNIRYHSGACVPNGKTREIWTSHGHTVDEDRLLQSLGSLSQKAKSRRGE
ncbi:hypothetical protein ACQKWADRAFT_306666 [Trichoderma austrokoningii]